MTETTEKKGASPVIRALVKEEGKFNEVLVLWPKSEDKDGKHDLSGTLEGKRVFGFIREVEGKSPFVSLRSPDGNGDFQDAGRLNAINKRKDGQTVYFDTLALDFADKDRDTVFARVTNAISDDLHAKLGFASPRADRPPRQKEEAHEEESAGFAPS